MQLLEINPLSKSTAITEMVLLLAGAALVGYLIGRWLTNSRIRELREALSLREKELNDCNTQQTTLASTAGNVSAEIPLATSNLKLIEGIGPKIEALLNAKGIYTFDQLAAATPHELSDILNAAGPRFQIHDPQTWPEQSALARDGKWEELERLQEKLTGGRE